MSLINPLSEMIVKMIYRRQFNKVNHKKHKLLILIKFIMLFVIAIGSLYYTVVHKDEIKDRLNRVEYYVKLTLRKDESNDIKNIIKNYQMYPTYLVKLAIDNKEAISFVKNYPEEKDSFNDIKLSRDIMFNKVPLLLQWDDRWGYYYYGDKVMGVSGCGPTCMSMVYIALTGDVSMNPKIMSEFSEDSGYHNSNGTIWTFMTEGANTLGLSSAVIETNIDIMINELENNHLLICSMSPGDFTTTGHFIVITGYKNNNFYVNDPNSVIRSNQVWSYDNLKDQIKQIWTFSYNPN
jgi:hypothetical protein